MEMELLGKRQLFRFSCLQVSLFDRIVVFKVWSLTCALWTSKLGTRWKSKFLGSVLDRVRRSGVEPSSLCVKKSSCYSNARASVGTVGIGERSIHFQL